MKAHGVSPQMLPSQAEPDEAMVLIRAADLRHLKDGIEEIKQHLLGKSHADHKEYLTQAEAEQYLNCKTTWLWEQRRKLRLPYRKLGKRVYYQRSDLDALIERGKR
jgi:hypothetical protein